MRLDYRLLKLEKASGQNVRLQFENLPDELVRELANALIDGDADRSVHDIFAKWRGKR